MWPRSPQRRSLICVRSSAISARGTSKIPLVRQHQRDAWMNGLAPIPTRGFRHRLPGYSWNCNSEPSSASNRTQHPCPRHFGSRPQSECLAGQGRQCCWTCCREPSELAPQTHPSPRFYEILRTYVDFPVPLSFVGRRGRWPDWSPFYKARRSSSRQPATLDIAQIQPPRSVAIPTLFVEALDLC